MTYKEAMDWFKDSLKDGKCSDECPQCNAMEKAVEALEKQIPKKPYFGEVLGYKSYLCPICRGWLLYPDERPTLGDTFCSFCGQKIDWSNI